MFTIDYPDLVLAGGLGGAVAGKPKQARAAITLALLADAWGLLLAAVPTVPATPPIAATFLLLDRWPVVRARAGAPRTRRVRCAAPACGR